MNIYANMRRYFIIMALAIATTAAWGAKATSEPITVRQADGTTLTIMLHGDEYFNWATTADGVLLKQVGSAYYIASVSTDGTLAPTRQLAHDTHLRGSEERKAIALQNRNLFGSKVTQNHARAKARQITIGKSTPNYFPHTGSPKALVLLVEFSDVKFTTKDPLATFNYYLNAKPGDDVPADNDINQSRNYGSVRQYFSDMSGGKYTPQFDLYGPFAMPDTSGYYGKGANDANYREMISKACAMADAAGVDFSQYDGDGDGYADLVYIIYAGYGASMSGYENDIWPKSGAGNFGTYDGVRVSRFGINNELNRSRSYVPQALPRYRVNGIGLFCHEFSHTLGLPDLYSGIAFDNQEMEYWDLMDGGEYTDNGYTPTPYTPWENEVMGWHSLTPLTQSGDYELKPYGEERKAFKVESDVEGNSEYLILQNIQNQGWWGKLLGHGMLVYRIDYGTRSAVNLYDRPNSTEGKPGITILPADGLLISSYRVHGNSQAPTEEMPYSQDQYIQSHYGDPFPGTSNVTRIDSVKMNNCVIRSRIYNIAENTEAASGAKGTITFSFKDAKTALAISSITAKESKDDTRIYTIDGRYAGNNPKELPHGVYIINKKKYVIR